MQLELKLNGESSEKNDEEETNDVILVNVHFWCNWFYCHMCTKIVSCTLIYHVDMELAPMTIVRHFFLYK